MLRGLYAGVMRLSGARHAQWALAAIALAESAFFPIPPDVLLIPMVLAKPERAWRYAAICAGCSVVGGVGGYAIGYGLAPVAHWLLNLFGLAGAETALRADFHKWGVGVILIQGLLPVPYKLLTIASGLAHFTLWKFVAASTVTRSARFFGVAGLVKRFGPTIVPVIEQRIWLVAAVVAAILVAVIVGLKLLH